MRKFKIPNPPSSTTKSIRYPNTVIAEVEEAFVVEAVRVSLENLRDED